MPTASPFSQEPPLFSRVARFVIRHPWHFIAFWIVLLLVTAPFLQYLGNVTTNSTTTLPSNAPSALAQSEFNRLFPNSTGVAQSDLVFTAPNMTDRNAQSVLGNVTDAIGSDPSLTHLASIDSIYIDYAQYVAGDLEIGATALQASLNSTPSLPQAINGTADVVWGPVAYFNQTWFALGGNLSANYPAYVQTERAFNGSIGALVALSAFYNGAPNPGSGFNGSLGCGADRATVGPCERLAVRLNVPSVLPVIFPPPELQRIGAASVTYLDFENYTSWTSVRSTVAELLAGSVGLPPSWILTTWDAFPRSVPSMPVALRWANATVANATLWTEPLPIPRSLLAQYVSASGTGQLVLVSFNVPDTFTDSSGASPVYSDLDRMSSLVPAVISRSDPTRSISFAQTGPSPLDQAQQKVVNAALQLVLPITVVVLIGITAIYFRSPVTPLVAFGGLAVALVLGLGGTVLLGTLITHVDTTSLTLEEVFVLGVGTDYSIFLLSRYREERLKGVEHQEAIRTSVTWAGQSVATSGTTAVIATLALTFSGVALLSQWGMVLSFAVLITILVSLTLVPAIVTVAGPRIFWPYTRERFRRQAARYGGRTGRQESYFYRVASLTRRRPLVVLGVVLLVSAPLVWAAINVPISYDFYAQLPASQPAVSGLNVLSGQFGPGFAFPTTALVTFSSPLLVGNHTNSSEFAELASLTSIAENTSGVAAVESLVGPYGASLVTWQNLSSAPLATQVHLTALASSFVGTDQRTVLLVVQTNASGLSAPAISALTGIESAFSAYAASHPAVTSVAYAGGAAETNDLAIQSSIATERLLLAVSVALMIVLFVVLRSWIIPLLAIATIGLSISWAWGATYLVLDRLAGVPIFFFVPTLMFILILGLGIDYNIFLLSRVREERLRGRGAHDAVHEGLGRTGGIITAAAVILAGAFGTLVVGNFALLVAIGFSVAAAVLLDAMVVRTYLVPSVLQLLGDRVWRSRAPRTGPAVPLGSRAQTPGGPTTAQPPRGPPNG